MSQVAVEVIDEALIQMRRLWAPVTSGRPAVDGVSLVDLSTVLVVDGISRLGGEPSVGMLAEHLGIAQTTASRLVTKAAEAGFVEKRSASDDVRRVALSLTQAGHELLKRSLEFRYAYLGTLLERWSIEEVEVFSTLLDRFATAVVESPPDPTAPPEGISVRFDKGSDFHTQEAMS